ncbi:MAG: YqeG family HAD IIIA-type phosphatase [Ruminococcaceae bacterium]|nr:YqeG family HAD IIIA-type phosphatase [Oscillospiraceae bacterium]
MKKKKLRSLSYLLTPDYMFKTFDEVTPDFLISHGIDALLIDIDNTLAPYEQAEPDEKILSWFDDLKYFGIRAALISNNHADRVELFNKKLGLPAYPDSGKPKSGSLIAAMREMGTMPENTAGLGDQLLTDTLAVHRLDMISIIVPPIKDKKTLFFRFKRFLERPYIRKYKKHRTNNF